MRQASYMLPEEHIKKIEDMSYQTKTTQDEIVRRALAEYLAKEQRESTLESIPRDIKTRLVQRGDA